MRWKQILFIVTGLILSCICVPGFPVSAESVPSDRVQQLQRAIDAAGAAWVAGDTWIAALSPEERRGCLGADYILDGLTPEMLDAVSRGGVRVDVPDPEGIGGRAMFDWRDHNGADWTTPAKNQFNCGSCVAFGTVSAMEAAWKIGIGDPGYQPDLSEQFLFSCGGGSCTSGWTNDSAYNYAQASGVPDEACLPYTAVDDNCNAACGDWRDRRIRIQDYDDVTGLFWPSETDLKQAVVIGPVTVSMIVYEDFYSYSGGVYEHVSGGLEGGHSVCLVGYDDSQQCWIVKNSWGWRWGENGFFRIRYGECNFGTAGCRPIITYFPATPTPAETPTPVPPTATATPYPATATPVATQTPIPTYTPYRTATPHQTATPVPTGTASPTATPVNTATPDPGEPGIYLWMNRLSFHAEDPFDLQVVICNPGDPVAADLYLLLEVTGSYWFWPSWSPEIDSMRLTTPDHDTATLKILAFEWPDLPVSIRGAGFWTALLDTHGELVCGYDYLPWKYTP